MGKTFCIYVTPYADFADLVVKNLSGNFADKGKFFVADYGGYKEVKMYSVYVAFDGIIYAEEFVSMGILISNLKIKGVPHV